MNEKEIHLSDYLRIFRKRRFTIISITLLVFMGATVFTFTRPPKYKASTKLLIENIKQESLSRDSRDNRRDPEFLSTQYQIIKSKSVARKVVKQLSLDTKYASYFVEDLDGTSSGGLRSRIRAIIHKILPQFSKKESPHDNFTEASAPARTLQDKITDFIANNIEVIPVRASRIAEISFSTNNPNLSRMIANAIAEAYMDELLEIRLNIANYKLNWMNEKAQSELVRLKKSEHDLQAYMQENRIIPIERGMAETPQKILELNAQLVNAETNRKELGLLYDQVRKMSTENMVSIPSAAASQVFLTLKDEILEAEKHIMELSISKKYGEQHPAMITAKSTLAGLKKLQQQEISNIVENIRTDYELARLKEENLNKSLGEAKKEAIQYNEKLIQYNILKREIETNRNLYETLLTSLKEQSLVGEIQTINVWVLEAAKTPEAPYKPKKAINLLIGLILGAAFGLACALFVEYLDTTIKLPDEIENRLGLPLLGTVFLSKLEKNAIIDSMIKNPNTALSERYKAIRASILLSSADNKPKVILITSASPNDGKTITSINLSLAMTHFKNKVLLIDADLRNPQVHKIFNLDNTNGLSTFAAGVSKGDIVQPGPMTGLDIITSGPKPPNPSEIVSSQNFNSMIEEMRSKYDMIIIDSAPALHVTDSLILSKIVDGTALVVRAGITNYATALDCIKSLKNINARLLGIIFNALNVKSNGYYGYYGDYGEYGAPPLESEKKK